MSGAENGAERAKTRVERSGAVSGSENNRAERSSAVLVVLVCRYADMPLTSRVPPSVPLRSHALATTVPILFLYAMYGGVFYKLQLLHRL